MVVFFLENIVELLWCCNYNTVAVGFGKDEGSLAEFQWPLKVSTFCMMPAIKNILPYITHSLQDQRDIALGQKMYDILFR